MMAGVPFNLSLHSQAAKINKKLPAVQALDTKPSGSEVKLPPLQPPSAEKAMPQLEAMESHWLGAPQPGYPLDKRIVQLEGLVFGRQMKPEPTATLQQRYDALVAVYKPPSPSWEASLRSPQPTQPMPTQPEKASTDVTSGAGGQKNANDGTTAVASNAANDSNLLNRLEILEEGILGRTQPTLGLKDRVNQLEIALYGAPLVGPVQERLEGLEARFHGNGAVASASPASVVTTNNAWSNSTTSANYGANASSSMGTLNSSLDTQDLRKLEQMEQNVFNKASLPNEAPETRLAKLEQAVFKQQAPVGMTPKQRLTRLEAVVSASPSGTVKDARVNQAVQMALPFVIGALLLLL